MGHLDSLSTEKVVVSSTCTVFAESEVIKDTKCDGIIMHMNRSCKMCDFLQYEIGQQLHQDLGIPITTFDGDQADPRNYSPAQYETRIDALVEMMDAKKEQE